MKKDYVFFPLLCFKSLRAPSVLLLCVNTPASPPMGGSSATPVVFLLLPFHSNDLQRQDAVTFFSFVVVSLRLGPFLSHSSRNQSKWCVCGYQPATLSPTLPCWQRQFTSSTHERKLFLPPSMNSELGLYSFAPSFRHLGGHRYINPCHVRFKELSDISRKEAVICIIGWMAVHRRRSLISFSWVFASTWAQNA